MRNFFILAVILGCIWYFFLNKTTTSQQPQQVIQSQLDGAINNAFGQMQGAITVGNNYGAATGMQQLGSLEGAEFKPQAESYAKTLVEKINADDQKYIEENLVSQKSEQSKFNSTEVLNYLLNHYKVNINLKDTNVLQVYKAEDNKTVNELLLQLKTDTVLTANKKEENLNDVSYYILIKNDKDGFKLLNFVGPTKESFDSLSNKQSKK